MWRGKLPTGVIEECLVQQSSGTVCNILEEHKPHLTTLSTPTYAVMQRKREKAERMKHLSQAIREQNQAMADSSSGRHSQGTKAITLQHSPASTRERMQAYARSVQKAAMHNRPPSPKRPRSARFVTLCAAWRFRPDAHGHEAAPSMAGLQCRSCTKHCPTVPQSSLSIAMPGAAPEFCAEFLGCA